MPALFEFFCGRAAQFFNCPYAKGGDACRFFAHAKLLCFIYLVVEAVEHKVNQVRHNCLRAFCFQKLYKVVVAGRREFYQNLTDNSHPGFFHILVYGNGVKISDNLSADTVKAEEIHVFAGDEILRDFQPFFMHGIDAAGFLFIGTHPIDAAHKDIAEDGAVSGAHQQIGIQVEARIALDTSQI